VPKKFIEDYLKTYVWYGNYKTFER
jgi:hypothetical protein